MVAPTRPAASSPPVERNCSDPAFKAAELAQRGRMILDVATADLAASEEFLGPFHETTWHFRNALAEARRSWDRLRAEFGSLALEAALAEPPLTFLDLGGGISGRLHARLIAIAGRTYRVESVPGTPLAPSLWRLTRLPISEDGPYYAAALRDGSLRCDCAEWVYQRAEVPDAPPCKHLIALDALGWL